MAQIDTRIMDWVCAELTRLLGTETNEDVAGYLLSMQSISDLSEYLNELLDSSLPQNKQFISELLKKWQQVHGGSADDGNSNAALNQTSSISPVLDFPKKTKKGKKKSLDSNSAFMSSPPEGGSANATPGSSGKKTTFVPLFSKEGHQRTTAMLPGRHHCDCQATKHSLISNCLKCGRVVCQQEGPGPCFFCGELVCTKDQQEILSRNSRKSEKLLNHLMSQVVGSADDEISKGYEKALEHKNKLLEYDRTSVKRTHVIDDESDYFSTDANQWLNEKEKAVLKQREDELRSIRHASRKDRKITYTLDFAGRQVVEEEPCVDVYNPNDSVVQEANFNVPENLTSVDVGKDNIVNPNIRLPPPKFIAEDGRRKETTKTNSSLADGSRKILRVQDGDLEQMSDNGNAMSMHQPWASLLVAGIKKHEGRTWYTQHRGTLWIASTAKTPTQDEIDQVENQYRLLYNDNCLQFPKCYPVGCLLGSVEVTDCMAHEDYVEQCPQGESESPYVFICENPRELPVKFPIKGKHKIYKLEGHLHKAAKKGFSGSTKSSNKSR